MSKRQPKDPLLDFRNFLFLVWAFLKLPQPTKRQYAIAHYLQHGPRRKIIEAFRGIGKSWITAAYVVWRLYCDPQSNILVVSASKQRADNFTTFCLQLIKGMPELQHLRPRNDQRESKLEFDVAPAEPDQSPSVKSAGIKGQITGMRADEIIADDCEVPNNSATQMMREQLSEAVKEFDAILKPDGRVTYLGTPQTESSIYNKLKGRGYELRVWPVRYPNADERAEYGSTLAPDILADLDKTPLLEGKSTEPTRFTELDLVERAVSYGRAGFAMQFMLRTRLSDEDRYPLKLRDLLVMHLDPFNGPERAIWAADHSNLISDLPNVGIEPDRLYRPVPLPSINYMPYQGVVLAVDPAGRGKDETGYAVVASLNGMLFLLDAGGLKGYEPETLQALAETAKRYKANNIIIEENFGDGMFAQLLKPIVQAIYPCGIEEVRHSTQKEKRIIDTLEPVMVSHRLVVNHSLIQKDYDSTQDMPSETAHRYQLFYQLTRITRDKGALANDDRLEAVAIAVAYWSKHMAQDIDKAVAKQKAEALAKELQRFTMHALGHKPQGPVWATR